MTLTALAFIPILLGAGESPVGLYRLGGLPPDGTAFADIQCNPSPAEPGVEPVTCQIILVTFGRPKSPGHACDVTTSRDEFTFTKWDADTWVHEGAPHGFCRWVESLTLKRVPGVYGWSLKWGRLLTDATGSCGPQRAETLQFSKKALGAKDFGCSVIDF